MSLTQKAQELLDEVYTTCPLEGGKITERYIITIKSNEVVCWSFECLICPKTNCLSRSYQKSGNY